MNTGFVDSSGKRVPRAGFANALNFATRRTARPERRMLVTNHAAGLAASAINAKEKCHGKILIAQVESTAKCSRSEQSGAGRLVRSAPGEASGTTCTLNGLGCVQFYSVRITSVPAIMSCSACLRSVNPAMM